MSEISNPNEEKHRTWLDPLQRVLILDEYPDKFMQRTVRAQVGFGALLILVQFSIDFLAWTLGLRWVFVDSLGLIAGWPLTIFFAFLISAAIAIFERFVLTADTSKTPLLKNPAVVARLLFITVAALVTSIPLEMMIFNDVIQGKINGEVSVLREDARSQFRNDVGNDLKRVEDTITKAEAARLAPIDRSIQEIQNKILLVADKMQEEEEGQRNGGPGKGPRYASLLSQRKELDELLDATIAKRERLTLAKEGVSPQVLAMFSERERLAKRMEMRLNDKELAEITQRSLRVPDGFARRYEIMNEQEALNPLFGQTKWAVRMVILALGLLVFMTKLFYNEATASYYASARPGANLQSSQGINSASNIGFQPTASRANRPQPPRDEEL